MLHWMSLLLTVFAIVRGSDIPPLKPDITNMSDRDLIIELFDRVNHLEIINGIQQKRMEEMKNTIDRQTRLLEWFGKIHSEHVEKAETEQIQETSQSTKIHGNQLDKNGKHRIRQVPDTRVAFSALANRHIIRIGAQQNLIFEVEHVDTTNVYDPQSGLFTVPVSGVYFITVTVFAGNNHEVWCEIVVNGAAKGNVYARGNDNRYDQGSQSLLLHLRKGDDMVVRNNAVDDVIGSLYTSFSAFLLFEEDLPQVVG